MKRLSTQPGMSERYSTDRVSIRRRNHLKRKYGMTEEDWDEMFDSQGKRCACCGIPRATMWVVDHCHDTGKVRGILCHHCNSGLGQFGDDIARLQLAVKYLREHSGGKPK